MSVIISPCETCQDVYSKPNISVPQLRFLAAGQPTNRTCRFFDIDAFVMNPAFKLEWMLDVAMKQQQTGGLDGWGKSCAVATLPAMGLVRITQNWPGLFLLIWYI